MKVAEERTKAPYKEKGAAPAEWAWPQLIKKGAENLFEHYRHMLDPLTVARHLIDRPTTIYGKWVHPDEAMREALVRYAAHGKSVADLLIENRD